MLLAAISVHIAGVVEAILCKAVIFGVKFLRGCVGAFNSLRMVLKMKRGEALLV